MTMRIEWGAPHGADLTITWEGDGDRRILLDPGDGLPRFVLDISRTGDGFGFDAYPEGHDGGDPVATAYLLYGDHPRFSCTCGQPYGMMNMHE